MRCYNWVVRACSSVFVSFYAWCIKRNQPRYDVGGGSTTHAAVRLLLHASAEKRKYHRFIADSKSGPNTGA